MTSSKIDNKINSGYYSKLFRKLNDPCVMFDLSEGIPMIIDSNDCFKHTFCSDNINPVGESLNDLIVPDRYMDEAQELDTKTVNQEVNERMVTRETCLGEEKFLYRGIPIENNRGFGMYISISDRIQEKEYIKVLNRILRHNLRNKLTVILGNSRMIRDNTGNPEIKELAENTVKSSSKIDQLVDESDKARDIINSNLKITSVQLQPIISNGVESALSRFDKGKVNVNCNKDIYVNANKKLNVVIESLVDNGIRYNNKEEPKVNIDCENTEDNSTLIKIRDFGESIPKQEADIINNVDDLSKTEHGSGLGLWISRWIINKLDGNIEIISKNIDGNIIKIEFQSDNPNTFNYRRGSAVFSS